MDTVGLDEEAHWFVCKSGFKSRCESLMYESHQDLGFVMYNESRDNDRGSAVNEMWGRNSLQQALIRGIGVQYTCIAHACNFTVVCLVTWPLSGSEALF